MPSIRFQIKKRADARAMLVLIREDRSWTGNEIGPAMGYGPVHDLAHYVVERAFRFTEGFLGLVASGWEVGDFEVPKASSVLPPEAVLAEFLAGELSREEMTQQASSGTDFRWGLDAYLKSSGRTDATAPAVSDELLAAMRAELVELRGQWRLTPLGGTLELPFITERRSTCARPVREAAPSRREARGR